MSEIFLCNDDMSAPDTRSDVEATDIVAKLPTDLRHVTVESLLPLLAVVMAHAQNLQQLSGPDKKKLVIACIDLLVARMPFPESQIIAPIVDAVAPAAIDGIVQGSRSARRHGGELLAARQWPGSRIGTKSTTGRPPSAIARPFQASRHDRSSRLPPSRMSAPPSLRVS